MKENGVVSHFKTNAQQLPLRTEGEPHTFITVIPSLALEVPAVAPWKGIGDTGPQRVSAALRCNARRLSSAHPRCPGSWNRLRPVGPVGVEGE